MNYNEFVSSMISQKNILTDFLNNNSLDSSVDGIALKGYLETIISTLDKVLTLAVNFKDYF